MGAGVRRLCIVAAIAGIALFSATANSDWLIGKNYEAYVSSSSGIMPSGAHIYRTFGDPSTIYANSSGSMFTWSDSSNTDGLLPNQVRLKFLITDVSQTPGTAWDIIPNANTVWLKGFTLPSGAMLRGSTAAVVYHTSNGTLPAQGVPFYSYTLPSQVSTEGLYAFGMPSSGILGGAYPDWASYEIVVDNIPEPATAGMLFLSAGVLGYIRRRRMVSRQ